MNIRAILGGTLMLIAASAPAVAGKEAAADGRTGLLGITIPIPKFGFARQAGPESNRDSVVLAQAGDPRITALEEQIRSLSGTVEELNFQVLQMQEQLRKMQEDNEFRFQEIEQRRSGAGNTGTEHETTQSTEQPESTTDTVIVEGEAEIQPGIPPKTFGTIVFDSQGNVVGGTVSEDSAPGVTPPPAPGGVVAALPQTSDPDELYRNAYEFVLSGDYPTAEAGFREHISRFPDDARTADAHFWLGEALLGQQKYRESAEIFLAASRDYPDSSKAPDMLLKLGISLAGLDQRDVACATFGEIAKRYPGASAALKERVKQEQALASC